MFVATTPRALRFGIQVLVPGRGVDAVSLRNISGGEISWMYGSDVWCWTINSFDFLPELQLRDERLGAILRQSPLCFLAVDVSNSGAYCRNPQRKRPLCRLLLYTQIISPIDGVTDEHFVVWMRTAARSTFRNLYGRIEHDLVAPANLTFNVTASEYRISLHSTSSYGIAANLLSGCTWAKPRDIFQIVGLQATQQTKLGKNVLVRHACGV